MIVVGIDCATLVTKTGLALGEYRRGVLALTECRVAARSPSLARQVLPWVQGGHPAALGMDSPLGWPVALGRALAGHRAGAPLHETADHLFKRRTDVLVRERLGKTPLEVGADRIARTALAALAFLEELGSLLGAPVELAWEPGWPAGPKALETYPAGTLRAYEKQGQVRAAGGTTERKRALVTSLLRSGRLTASAGARAGLRIEHALDAALCAVTAADFLDGACTAPEPGPQAEAARGEGWIWVRAVAG